MADRIASALMSGDVDGDGEGHKGPIALAGSGNPTSISVIIKNLIFQLWIWMMTGKRSAPILHAGPWSQASSSVLAQLFRKRFTSLMMLLSGLECAAV
jgi:hypothetical protein